MYVQKLCSCLKEWASHTHARTYTHTQMLLLMPLRTFGFGVQPLLLRSRRVVWKWPVGTRTGTGLWSMCLHSWRRVLPTFCTSFRMGEQRIPHATRRHSTSMDEGGPCRRSQLVCVPWSWVGGGLERVLIFRNECGALVAARLGDAGPCTADGKECSVTIPRVASAMPPREVRRVLSTTTDVGSVTQGQGVPDPDQVVTRWWGDAFPKMAFCLWWCWWSVRPGHRQARRQQGL